MASVSHDTMLRDMLCYDWCSQLFEMRDLPIMNLGCVMSRLSDLDRPGLLARRK
jgi:hypothetical protein